MVQLQGVNEPSLRVANGHAHMKGAEICINQLPKVDLKVLKKKQVTLATSTHPNL